MAKFFYISMGQAHVHRINGKVIDKDCIVEMEAPTELEARTRAFELFGMKWAFSYKQEQVDEEFMKHFPRGIIRL